MKYYFVLVENVEKSNVVGTYMQESDLLKLKSNYDKNKNIIREYEIPEGMFYAIDESAFIGSSSVDK